VYVVHLTFPVEVFNRDISPRDPSYIRDVAIAESAAVIRQPDPDRPDDGCASLGHPATSLVEPVAGVPMNDAE
jgi:hypothetical protein